AIPYRGVPADMLERAVRHALAQTHTDHVVLVVGDGERPPLGIRHDRLVVGTFPRHRGAPFTQQAMLLGSPFDLYAPHGADDYTEPEHLASLLALRWRAAGSSSIWWHGEDGKAVVLHSPRTWIEFGVFRTDTLRAIGGFKAARPCVPGQRRIRLLSKHLGVRVPGWR